MSWVPVAAAPPVVGEGNSCESELVLAPPSEIVLVGEKVPDGVRDVAADEDPDEEAMVVEEEEGDGGDDTRIRGRLAHAVLCPLLQSCRKRSASSEQHRSPTPVFDNYLFSAPASNTAHTHCCSCAIFSAGSVTETAIVSTSRRSVQDVHLLINVSDAYSGAQLRPCSFAFLSGERIRNSATRSAPLSS